MEELKDLKELASELIDRYQTLYIGKELELPTEFRNRVTEIYGNNIAYQKYSAVISTRGVQRGVLNIYMPNQWFYIASFFTEYYKELQKYKLKAMAIFSQDRLKQLKGNSFTEADERRLNASGYNILTNNLIKKFVTDYEWWGGGKTIDRGDFYVSPILNYAKLVNASQSYVADLCAFLSENDDLVKILYNAISHDNNVSGNSISQLTNSAKLAISRYWNCLTALRTKPFLLLAGISGTGKSQKVQELAFMTCPDGELRNEGGTTPGNYCLVEVKPNWHDSTDLLGYYSTLSGKYELTDFIRFVYKATQNKDVPFFLCLDEMNLAPVEQYFAEFLSVLETRKKVGDEIQTQYLLSKDRFSNCELQKKVLVKEDGDIIEGDKQYKMEFMYSEKDTEIITYLKENGLTLPDNLFVIGTVNMDDTTHQFSRKVIDRAFTIEMNGGKMSEMFAPESKALLEYREEPVPLEAFKSQFVRAYEVLEDTRFTKYKDVISTRIPKLLGDSDGTAEADSINGMLNDTPFRVSYRVQNELVIYLSTLIERAGFPDDIKGLIGEAMLAILLEKVLPRIQGEQKQLETKKNGNTSNVLKDLKTFVESHYKPTEETDASSLYNQVLRKLNEMDDKLANYYTNFF